MKRYFAITFLTIYALHPALHLQLDDDQTVDSAGYTKPGDSSILSRIPDCVNDDTFQDLSVNDPPATNETFFQNKPEFIKGQRITEAGLSLHNHLRLKSFVALPPPSFI